MLHATVKSATLVSIAPWPRVPMIAQVTGAAETGRAHVTLASKVLIAHFSLALTAADQTNIATMVRARASRAGRVLSVT